jgi:hypothetical protein
MSNGSSSSYAGVCRKDIPYPSVSSESVPSLIDNLVIALYGTITKSVINRRVVWNIPCDPNNTSTINGIPRNTDEGLLCYIIRALNLTTATAGYVTANGVETLTNKTLTSPVINTATINTATINNLTTTGTLTLAAGSITSAMIANGSIVPVDLSTGGPNWDAGGNLTATSFIGSLSGNATTATNATNATNVTSGVAGAVPYQLAPSSTGFTAAGTSGQVLSSNGTSAPSWLNQSALSVGTSTNATNVTGGIVSATTITASSTIVASSFRNGGNSGPTISTGSGSPDGVVTAPIGSLYTNTAGGYGNTLWVKDYGTGNTEWTAVPTSKSQLFTSASYANDAAAAAGGINQGQLYRNGSVVQIRMT